MVTVTIKQAKAQLSKLLARAEAGEEVIIARGKKPVIRLQLVRRRRPGFGSLKGKLSLPDDLGGLSRNSRSRKTWSRFVRRSASTIELVFPSAEASPADPDNAFLIVGSTSSGDA